MWQRILVARSFFAPGVLAVAHEYRVPAGGSEASRTLTDAACIVLEMRYATPVLPEESGQIISHARVVTLVLAIRSTGVTQGCRETRVLSLIAVSASFVSRCPGEPQRVARQRLNGLGWESSFA